MLDHSTRWPVTCTKVWPVEFNNTTPLRVRRGLLREGEAMIEDIIGWLVAAAFGVAVAFQIGGEG